MKALAGSVRSLVAGPRVGQLRSLLLAPRPLSMASLTHTYPRTHLHILYFATLTIKTEPVPAMLPIVQSPPRPTQSDWIRHDLLAVVQIRELALSGEVGSLSLS